MAISLPAAGDKLNSPSHSTFHRIVAADLSAPEQTIAISTTQVIIKAPANSVTAIQFNKADGTTNVLNIDTTNARVGIGTTAPLYPLDIRTASGLSQLHLSSDATDAGMYLGTIGTSNALLMAGMIYNGSAWVAKATTASMVDIFNGNIYYYGQSGLTAGNTFTPTILGSMTVAGKFLWGNISSPVFNVEFLSDFSCIARKFSVQDAGAFGIFNFIGTNANLALGATGFGFTNYNDGVGIDGRGVCYTYNYGFPLQIGGSVLQFTNYITAANIPITTRLTTQPTVVIKAIASQTADLQKWVDVNAATLAVVDVTGNFGIGTSVPGKALEINHATGQCLRLTYNDSNGSAANYTDLTVGSNGALTLTSTANSFTFGNGVADTDTVLNFTGTTKSGVLTWMEDEDYFKFSDDIMLVGGENIVLDTTTGTKIGTATSQLLGFYNAVPVDQPATVADPSSGGVQDVEARTAINAIIDRLQELGLIG